MLKEVLFRNPFTVAWLVWILVFFFVEGLAIWSGVDRATFSSHLRDFLRHQPWWVVGAGWLLMATLAVHFLVGLRS